jgi:3-oxo-5-alpha-steroid 4-dehydrogenase 3
MSKLTLFFQISLCTTPQVIMDPALLCKVFFNIGTAVDIGGTLIPSFREQIMNYGSRGMKPQKSEAKDPKPRSKLASLFDYVASIKVPHTWFTHYYIVSVASSIFWGIQIATRGRAFECLVTYSKGTPSTMIINQIFLAWSLMTIQGTRRLAESIIFTKPSQSKMWFGLWVLGIAYYVFMGISVWIEGIGEWSDPLKWLTTDRTSCTDPAWRHCKSPAVLKPIIEDFNCAFDLRRCICYPVHLPQVPC